ncbi:hypothetical protein GOV13_05045 [Candidatus Pacearchaeota archaeon]|nr:hypothetical protein [Candidatus Pacearchaeota archaeon]
MDNEKYILIVSASEEKRERISSIFYKQGDHTSDAIDHINAIDKLIRRKKNGFGLVLTDINKQTKGFKLLSGMKKSKMWYKDLPVIGMYDRPKDKLRWSREGGIGSLHSIFFPEDLITIVDAFYNKKLVDRT